MKSLRKLLFFLLITLVCPLYASATPDSNTNLKLASGTEIPVARFGNNPQRILWLPSEYGLESTETYPLARSMAAQGLEVWMPDLHSAYFLTPGRTAMSGVSPQAIADLIQSSLPDDPQGKLYVLSSERSSALALLALQQWQKTHPDETRFGGMILLHPNLSANTPEPGQPESWLPVVEQTRAALFIIQPENSGKRFYLTELSDKLLSGGSIVYSKLVKDASDGYLTREEREEAEIKQAKQFPTLAKQAVDMLTSVKLEAPAATQPTAAASTATDDSKGLTVSDMKEGLQPFPGDKQAPALKLTDIDGKTHDLQDYRGKVVLLNFWSTWCPPCIKEIPSLGRLQAKFAKDEFVVLSVDVGQPEEDVIAFLENYPADYPVMLDPAGNTVKPWDLRAFPTTFVLDPEGYIRLAYFGGLEWDEPAVVDTLKTTMKLETK
ncbi:MAG: TlpA family protein disulfide reductase [Candidatus Thiothrix moscowensis]|nr:TlpA family protein disulfide reductase [Candidatus Thiothrix moscowensis]